MYIDVGPRSLAIQVAGCSLRCDMICPPEEFPVLNLEAVVVLLLVPDHIHPIFELSTYPVSTLTFPTPASTPIVLPAKVLFCSVLSKNVALETIASKEAAESDKVSPLVN